MPRTLMLSVIRGVALRGLAVTAVIGASRLAAPMVFAAEKFAAPEASQAPAAVGAGSLDSGDAVVVAGVGRRVRGRVADASSAWLRQVWQRCAPGRHRDRRRSEERVVLVQVGKQQLLIGVAPGRVSTLHVLDEPVTPQASVAFLRRCDGSTPQHPTDFKAILKRSLGL